MWSNDESSQSPSKKGAIKLKYATATLALALSATAYAGKFRILNEYKYLSPEGVPMFDGVSSYSEHLFISNGSSYMLLITEKITSPRVN